MPIAIPVTRFLPLRPARRTCNGTSAPTSISASMAAPHETSVAVSSELQTVMFCFEGCREPRRLALEWHYDFARGNSDCANQLILLVSPVGIEPTTL